MSAAKALILSTILGAANVALAAQPLTYREALQASLDANPNLKRTVLSTDQAEAALLSAQSIFDPTYNLSGSYTQATSTQFFGELVQFQSQIWRVNNNVSATGPTGTTVSLGHSFGGSEFGGALGDETNFDSNLDMSITQQLLKGLSLRYNMENVTLSRRNWETAKLTQERTVQETLSQAGQAYWTWVYQSDLMAIANESVRVAEEALRVGELKVQAGELAPVEQTRLEAALVQAQSNAIDAKNSSDTASNNLLLAMGQTPGKEIQPATDPGEVADLSLDEIAAVDVAMTQNLEVLVAEANLENAELQLRNARHNRLPSLSATATVGRQIPQAGSSSEAFTGVFGSDALPSSTLSGNLSVPLLNRSARGNARTQEASVSQTRITLDETRRNITAQVEQQVRQLQSSQRRVELADANQRLAEETLAAEEALSDAGRAIQKDVLEARTEVERTRAEAAKARTDYRMAQLELLRLQGQLSIDGA